MFDSDKAASRCTSMWKKAGAAFEALGANLIERNSPLSALRCFQIADTCFWQATGESASIQFKDILAQEPK